jgi:hypothetical protein
MTGRFALLRRGLIGAVEHALAEGATLREEVVIGGIRVESVYLGTVCVECDGILVERDSLPPGAVNIRPDCRYIHVNDRMVQRCDLDWHHEPAPDDEATGVVFVVGLHQKEGVVSYTHEDTIWGVLGVDGLCIVLDELVRPPNDWDMARYLAFGPTEEPA